jgi:hypothetical protein
MATQLKIGKILSDPIEGAFYLASILAEKLLKSSTGYASIISIFYKEHIGTKFYGKVFCG